MEIKDKNGGWFKIEKGDWIGDGYEDGSVIEIRKDGGDIWFEVFDGKEGWSLNLREVRSVNGDKVEVL
jgi:hypothetical protein